MYKRACSPGSALVGRPGIQLWPGRGPGLSLSQAGVQGTGPSLSAAPRAWVTDGRGPTKHPLSRRLSLAHPLSSHCVHVIESFPITTVSAVTRFLVSFLLLRS